MTKNEIKVFYIRKIDDIQDEVKKEELLDKLEEVDQLLFEIDSDIEEELENQDSDYLPTQKEYFEDFESVRKEIML